MKSSQETSKRISFWLRHDPADAGLEADEFGWVPLEQLLAASKKRGLPLDVTALQALNGETDKVRWEIDVPGNRVRATHGHSFPVALDDKVQAPPAVLYHGTNQTALPKIQAGGILPMRRHFVHLSSNAETATVVARRQGQPCIIGVNAKALANDGWTFYQTSDEVWLTTAIPAPYLVFN